MIIRRETQKVRAIELPSRVERWDWDWDNNFEVSFYWILFRFQLFLIFFYCRWNYSVGLHNVTITHNGAPECNLNPEKSEEFHVRAVVPKGLLLIFRESNPNDSLWQYEVYKSMFEDIYTSLLVYPNLWSCFSTLNYLFIFSGTVITLYVYILLFF